MAGITGVSGKRDINALRKMDPSTVAGMINADLFNDASPTTGGVGPGGNYNNKKRGSGSVNITSAAQVFATSTNTTGVDSPTFPEDQTFSSNNRDFINIQPPLIPKGSPEALQKGLANAKKDVKEEMLAKASQLKVPNSFNGLNAKGTTEVLSPEEEEKYVWERAWSLIQHLEKKVNKNLGGNSYGGNYRSYSDNRNSFDNIGVDDPYYGERVSNYRNSATYDSAVSNARNSEEKFDRTHGVGANQPQISRVDAEKKRFGRIEPGSTIAVKLEELFWIMLLVCSKSGTNSSLRSRIQHLFMTTPGVQLVLKRANCDPESYLGKASAGRLKKHCPDIFKECLKWSQVPYKERNNRGDGEDSDYSDGGYSDGGYGSGDDYHNYGAGHPGHNKSRRTNSKSTNGEERHGPGHNTSRGPGQAKKGNNNQHGSVLTTDHARKIERDLANLSFDDCITEVRDILMEKEFVKSSLSSEKEKEKEIAAEKAKEEKEKMKMEGLAGLAGLNGGISGVSTDNIDGGKSEMKESVPAPVLKGPGGLPSNPSAEKFKKKLSGVTSRIDSGLHPNKVMHDNSVSHSHSVGDTVNYGYPNEEDMLGSSTFQPVYLASNAGNTGAQQLSAQEHLRTQQLHIQQQMDLLQEQIRLSEQGRLPVEAGQKILNSASDGMVNFAAQLDNLTRKVTNEVLIKEGASSGVFGNNFGNIGGTAFNANGPQGAIPMPNAVNSMGFTDIGVFSSAYGNAMYNSEGQNILNADQYSTTVSGGVNLNGTISGLETITETEDDIPGSNMYTRAQQQQQMQQLQQRSSSKDTNGSDVPVNPLQSSMGVQGATGNTGSNSASYNENNNFNNQNNLNSLNGGDSLMGSLHTLDSYNTMNTVNTMQSIASVATVGSSATVGSASAINDVTSSAAMSHPFNAAAAVGNNGNTGNTITEGTSSHSGTSKEDIMNQDHDAGSATSTNQQQVPGPTYTESYHPAYQEQLEQQMAHQKQQMLNLQAAIQQQQQVIYQAQQREMIQEKLQEQMDYNVREGRIPQPNESLAYAAAANLLNLNQGGPGGFGNNGQGAPGNLGHIGLPQNNNQGFTRGPPKLGTRAGNSNNNLGVIGGQPSSSLQPLMNHINGHLAVGLHNQHAMGAPQIGGMHPQVAPSSLQQHVTGNNGRSGSKDSLSGSNSGTTGISDNLNHRGGNNDSRSHTSIPKLFNLYGVVNTKPITEKDRKVGKPLYGAAAAAAAAHQNQLKQMQEPGIRSEVQKLLSNERILNEALKQGGGVEGLIGNILK